MKKITDILFPVLILTALLLPSLYFLGVEENFTRLYGAESIPKPIPLTVKNYASGTFQKNLDEIFGKKFFLRKSFSRCRNSLYAACNFGCFHAAGTVFGSPAGWLLEGPYLDLFYGKYSIDENKNRDCFQLFEKLAQEFKKRDIDFIYVMAPDKVLMYPERLPSFYSLYLKRSTRSPHAEFAAILKKRNVPHFDAFTFLYRFRDRTELFPVSGTHWNAPAVFMMLNAMLKQLNQSENRAFPYQIPVPDRFETTSDPRYCENDLGNLTNLIHPPERIGLDPVFSLPKLYNAGDAIIMGDSFAHQINLALADSHCFRRTFRYENSLPTEQNFHQALNSAKMFILVYTTHKLFSPRNRHAGHLKIYEMLRRYPGPKRLPVGQNIPVTSLDDYMMPGFSGRESKGRWSGRECFLRLPIPTEVKTPVRLSFSGWPMTPDQVVKVKIAHDKILKVLHLPRKGRYSVDLPAECISKNSFIDLKLEFPQARKPANGRDPRILSFFFTDLELTVLPKK